MFITHNSQVLNREARSLHLVESVSEVAGVSGVSESVSGVSSISEVSVSVSESVVAEGSSNGGKDGSVVDERSGSRDDPGSSGEDGGVGLMLLPLLGGGGGGGSNGGKVGGGGLGNLGGELGGDQRLRVEGGGNQRLWVEDGSDGKTRVSDAESGSVSNVLHLLENSSSVDVRVSTLDSSVGVADLLLGRVRVGVAVVQVAELILGVELAAGVGRGGVGGDVGGSSHSRGVSSSVGSSGVAEGNSVDGVGEDCGASNGGCHKGRDSDEESHDVTRCVMLNGVPLGYAGPAYAGAYAPAVAAAPY